MTQALKTQHCIYPVEVDNKRKTLFEPYTIVIKKDSLIEVRGSFSCGEECDVNLDVEALKPLTLTLLKDVAINDTDDFSGAEIKIVDDGVLAKNENLAQKVLASHFKVYHTQDRKLSQIDYEISQLRERIRGLERNKDLIQASKTIRKRCNNVLDD